MATAGYVLAPRWIIPIVPAETVLEDHALVISGSDIEAILPVADAAARYGNRFELIELPDQALLPGLVNSHTHAPMTLMRGYADDRPLMDWLENFIWPAEAKWVDEDYVRDGSRLAVAEMLCGGTTCFNDMYFYPEVTAKVAEDMDIRAVIGLILIDFPSRYAGTSDEYLQKGLKLYDDVRHSPTVSCLFAPHAPYSVSDDALGRVATLAEELDIGIHMHVHETEFEVSDHQSRHGVRPLERLSQLGLVGPRMTAVHMTQLMQGEIASLAESGVKVVHCPQSNLKLASGTSPVQQLIDAGITVALGTDGAASNNDLDMLSELQTAALVAKGASGDPTAVPAHTALEMATINGARSLGLEHRIGSLTATKAADVISIDLGGVNTQPVFDPISQIVYSANRSMVRHVFVNGRHVVDDGNLVGVDSRALIDTAKRWGERMANDT